MGLWGISERPPRNVRGPFARFKATPELVVAGVRHHVIRDDTGLEGLEVLAMGTGELSEAPGRLPERARERLITRQGRQALTDAGLVRRRTGTRNPGIQSESRQERH
jgi:hypothetical protein